VRRSLSLVARVGTAGTLVLALANVAWAAGWTPPLRVRSVDSNTTAIDDFRIAVNAAGETAVVWEEETPGVVVQVAVRAPGGAFGLVSPAPSQPGATGPRVGIDAAGNVTVAWIRGGVVQTAVRPAGGAFAGAQDVLGSGTSPSDLELGVDASGRALAIWRASPVLKASVRPANGVFGPPTDFTGIGSPMTYESILAANARGDVVAVIYATGGSPSYQFSTYAWADGGATYLGPGFLSIYVKTNQLVAVGAQGDAAVVWKQTYDDPPANPSALRASIRPAGGPFTASPIIVPGTGVGSGWPSAAVDAAGNTLVVWSEGGVMRSSVRPTGGNFGAPQDIPGTAGGTESRVIFLPDGTALAAFFENDRIAAAVRPPGGAFGAAAYLSSSEFFASDVELAVDDEGNVLAIWNEQPPGEQAIGAAYWDPTPPHLDAFAVPPTVRVGQALDVTVTAFDRVGPVTVAWSFGDGGTASTPAASHVYTAAGTHPVIVTATDAVGNQSTQSATVLVQLCTSIDDCHSIVVAALPDPGASSGPARRVARRLATLARQVDTLLDKASRTTGRKQAKRYARAAAKLDRLLALARDAQTRERLGVPLGPLESAVGALRAFVPAPQ
jgi:hypothetical protein